MVACANCGETISVDASACSFCAYAPGEELLETAKWRFSVGIYCIVFVITSPFALYFLPAAAVAWWKAKKATPAELQE